MSWQANPARQVLRTLQEKEIAALHNNAARYVKNLGRYLDSLVSENG